jgi:hypothetical protein
VKEPQPKAFDTEIDVGFNDPLRGFSGRALFGFTYTNRSPYQLPLTAGLIHVAWTAYNIIDAVERMTIAIQ